MKYLENKFERYRGGSGLDDRELERSGSYQELMLREMKGRIWKQSRENIW